MPDYRLTPDQLDEFVKAACDAGLADPERRKLLLLGLPKSINLPVHSRNVDQLESDIHTLNKMTPIEGVAPLLIWLRIAIRISSHQYGKIFMLKFAVCLGGNREGTAQATIEVEGTIEAGGILSFLRRHWKKVLAGGAIIGGTLYWWSKESRKEIQQTKAQEKKSQKEIQQTEAQKKELKDLIVVSLLPVLLIVAVAWGIWWLWKQQQPAKVIYHEVVHVEVDDNYGPSFWEIVAGVAFLVWFVSWCWR